MTRLHAVLRGAFDVAPYLLIVLGILQYMTATNATERLIPFGVVAFSVLFLAMDRMLDEIRGLRRDLKDFRADLEPGLALLREVHLVRGHYNEDGEFIADNGEN